MRGLVQVTIIGFCLLGSGCANEHAIFRTVELKENRGFVTDAEQRFVTISSAHEDQEQVGRIKPERITCVEPSPDVAQALSTALSATLEAAMAEGPTSQQVGGTFALSTTESIAQLGERLATIQLLRDELADLCRSYSNGAVSATTYTLRLSRLDKKMVTLLVSETSAGAFGRTLASISGTASSSFTPAATAAEIEVARSELKGANDKLKASQDALDGLPATATDAEKKAKQSDRDKNQELVNEKQMALARLERLYAAAFTSGSAQAGVGAIENRKDAIAVNFSEIQRQFLEDDDLGTLLDACVSTLDVRARQSPEAVAKLLAAKENAEKNVAAAGVALEKAEMQLKAAETRLAASQQRADGDVTAPAIEVYQTGVFREQLADAAGQYRSAQATSESASEAYFSAVSTESQPSSFGRFCQDYGFQTVLASMQASYQNRLQLAEHEWHRSLAEERALALPVCRPVLDGTAPATTTEALRQYCDRLFKGIP